MTVRSMASEVTRPLVAVWLASAVMLAALVAALTAYVESNPASSQDQTIMDWVVGWDFPGLDGFMESVSVVTSLVPGMGLGLMGIALLLLLGLNREAVALAVIGAFVGVGAFTDSRTLGEIVGRSAPLEESSRLSFPSGHVFGATVLFGFYIFLAIYYGLHRRLRIPLVTVLAILIASVGISRIYVHAHWPTDVLGAYLLGGLWLLAVIPMFLFIRRLTWLLPGGGLREDLGTLACEGCRIEKSIASVVVLDPEQGTATKVYTPPLVVRLLYWLSFQAKFPYESNRAALRAARYRREIASLLTKHRFGQDLVAHVTAVDCPHGGCSFVTEFVPGEKVERDDDEGRLFLGQVTETFAEAGLSVWQVNPRNPHAHTNLIRTPDGDFKIIDLESALVTPLPARGQWTASLRRGNIPVFDDLQFDSLRMYVADNKEALRQSLGTQGLAQLNDAVDRCEQAINAWQASEPRIWGWIISRVYRLFAWKGYIEHKMGSFAGADRAAEAYLRRGIERWEKEGRLISSEASSLLATLSLEQSRTVLRHLGAHLVITAIFRMPLGSLVRLGWTMTFWARTVYRRIRTRVGGRMERSADIHSLTVMALTIIPGFGGIAYLAAYPARRRLIARVAVDYVAWKLPFGLYRRMRLGRWLAPAPEHTVSNS